MKKLLTFIAALVPAACLAVPLYTIDWTNEVLTAQEVRALVEEGGGGGGGVDRDAVVDIFNDIFTNDASRVTVLSNMFDNVSHRYIENINGEAYGLMVAEATNVVYSSKTFRFSFTFQEDAGGDIKLWPAGNAQIILREDDLKNLIKVSGSDADRPGVAKCDLELSLNSPVYGNRTQQYGYGLLIDQIRTSGTDSSPDPFTVNAVQVNGDKVKQSFPLGGQALYRIDRDLSTMGFTYGIETPVYVWFAIAPDVAGDLLSWAMNSAETEFVPTNYPGVNMFFMRPSESKESYEKNPRSDSDFKDGARVYMFQNSSTNDVIDSKNVVVYRDTKYETVTMPYGPMSPVITEWHLNIATNSWNEKINSRLDTTLSNWVNGVAAAVASNKVEEVADDLLSEIRGVVGATSNTLVFVSNSVEAIRVDATNVVATSIVEVVRTAYRDATENIADIVRQEIPSAAQIAYIAATNIEHRIGNTDSAAYALRSMREGYVEKYNGYANNLYLTTDSTLYTNSLLYTYTFVTTNFINMATKVYSSAPGTINAYSDSSLVEYIPNNRLQIVLALDGRQKAEFDAFIAGEINPRSLSFARCVVSIGADRSGNPLEIVDGTKTVEYRNYEVNPYEKTYTIPFTHNNTYAVVKTELSKKLDTVKNARCSDVMLDFTDRSAFLDSFGADPYRFSDAAVIRLGYFIGTISGSKEYFAAGGTVTASDVVSDNVMGFYVVLGRFTNPSTGETVSGIGLIPNKGQTITWVSGQAAGRPATRYGLYDISSFLGGIQTTVYFRYVGDGFTARTLGTNTVSTAMYVPEGVTSAAASVDYVIEAIDEKITDIARNGITIDGVRYVLDEAD